jgi:predicted RNA binding protein YcfA (HicA-like mRNA interferase family)
MGSHEKLLRRILAGQSDANISFSELRGLLLYLGFEERTRGSHHIFRRVDIEERINLQRQGSEAKPYQVGQVRKILLRYRLGEMFDG